jgi:hypothetical protein
MKSTASLKILCSSDLPENRLNIHPNEGADLGWMMTWYSVELDEGQRAEVHLLNECPKECVEIGRAFWEKMGRPTRAILRYDGSRLKIERA